MTEISIYHLDLAEQLISNSDLEADKAYEIIQNLTEKFTSINLNFLAALSSPEFLNYIHLDYKAEIESKKIPELDRLQNESQELIKKIKETDKKSPDYEKLINAQEEVLRKMADIILAYSMPIVELEKYQPHIRQLLLELQDRLNKSNIENENIKSKIRNSKIRIRTVMVAIAVFLAVISDYVVVFIERKLNFEKLHLLFVVLITLFLVLIIEPKQKKYELNRNKDALLNQIKHLKERYYEYDAEIKKIAKSLQVTKEGLWNFFKNYLDKFKK
jgi:hypothetical protein